MCERSVNASCNLLFDAIMNERDVTLPVRNASFKTLILLELDFFENIKGAEYRVEKELGIQGPTKELCTVIKELNKSSSNVFFQSPCS